MFECLFECLKDLPAITAFITARKKKCNQKLNNEQRDETIKAAERTAEPRLGGAEFYA